MIHAAVTLEYERKRIDLALPLNTPARDIVDCILEICGIQPAPDQTFALGLETETGGVKRIPPGAHLEDVGVLQGAVLRLTAESAEHASPAMGAFLRADGGEVFAVSGMTVIGRRDPRQGITVDIDLGPFDTGRIISRRHAAVEHRDGYVIMDLASINGTFVNAKRLAPRAPEPLKNGDEIVFGRNGVRLKFVEGDRPVD
jgi:hypothetical protein